MKYALVVAIVMMVSGSASAQEALTLDKAIGFAMERNHALLGATHDLEAARWGRNNAITNFLPRVEISSNLTRIDPESERRANAAVDFIKASAGTLGIPASALSEIKPFAYRDAYTTGITVVQPIYNGGAEIVGLNAAMAMKDKSEYEYQDTEQDIIARVKTTYLSVLKSEELLLLAKESAERTNRWLEMTRRRAALGSRTQTDVLRFQVQLAADEGNIVSAENYVALARLQLNDLMGVELERQFQLDHIAVTDSGVALQSAPSALVQLASVASPITDNGVSQSFLSNHPSIKMMEANLRLADINVDKSWVNFQPRVNLAFQYGWEKNNTLKLDGIRPWALSLSVSLPLFNGFGDYTNLERAHAEYQRTEEQVESFRRGLLLQATNAHLNLKATQKRIEIARIGLQQALDVLNSVTRRYDSGAASNVDVIDAQTAYNAAKTSYITSVFDNHISEVQLARATGAVTR